MFAYCNNNPSNCSDLSGALPYISHEFGSNTMAYGSAAPRLYFAPPETKTKVEEIVEAIQKIDAASSTGVAASASLTGVFDFTAQLGISSDYKGNIAVQGSLGGGFTTGTPGASAGIYKTYSNAPTIYNLEGFGAQIGVSAVFLVSVIPIAISADVNFFPDTITRNTYLGQTYFVGIGVPGPPEFHVNWGDTATIEGTEFNFWKLLLG